MFVVIATIRGKRPDIYGPFSTPLSAADWAQEHSEETMQACEIRPLTTAIVYGEEGL